MSESVDLPDFAVPCGQIGWYKVIAPESEAVNVGFILAVTSVITGVKVLSNEEKSLLQATGRGRLAGFSFFVSGSNDAHQNDQIIILIDGSERLRLSMANIDALGGGTITQQHADGSTGTIYAKWVNSLGGVVYAIRPSGTEYWTKIRGYLNIGSEFATSCEIKFFNASGEDVIVSMVVILGTYL